VFVDRYHNVFLAAPHQAIFFCGNLLGPETLEKGKKRKGRRST